MSPISGKPRRSNGSVKSTTTEEEEEEAAEGGREEGMGGGRLCKGTTRWPQAFFFGRVLVEEKDEVEKRRRGFERRLLN